jgi:hydroxyacylglutathione hydrolase
MAGSSLIDRRKVVGQFQCNCRILVDSESGEGLVVDPGDDAEVIIAELKAIEKEIQKPVRLKYLLHTHGHLDHVGATRDVKEAGFSDSKIALHPADVDLYLQINMQGKMFGKSYREPLPVEELLEHEQELRVGRMKLSVIHVPGHSPGSVGLRLHEDSSLGLKETLFSGDTLFRDSVGRTDLWGSDGDLMFKMIKNRFLTLDADTCVCPGHGPDSVMGREKRENPFLI